MRIDNNIHTMTSSAIQMNQTATNIADISNTIVYPEQQEVTQDLINAIAAKIPEVISYEANAQGIKTQNAVADVLLNLKA